MRQHAHPWGHISTRRTIAGGRQPVRVLTRALCQCARLTRPPRVRRGTSHCSTVHDGMHCVERQDQVEHGNRNGRRRRAASAPQSRRRSNATLNGSTSCSSWALISLRMQGNTNRSSDSIEISDGGNARSLRLRTWRRSLRTRFARGGGLVLNQS